MQRGSLMENYAIVKLQEKIITQVGFLYSQFFWLIYNILENLGCCWSFDN